MIGLASLAQRVSTRKVAWDDHHQPATHLRNNPRGGASPVLPAMRFKTELKNIRTFNKLIGALNSLEKIAWVRLDDDTARFTVIPETGSQVWA